MQGLCVRATATKLEEFSDHSDLVTLFFWPGAPGFGQISSSSSPTEGTTLHFGASSNLGQMESASWQKLKLADCRFFFPTAGRSPYWTDLH